MADNTLQTGNANIRAKDRAGIDTQIFGIDVAIGTATEALMSATNPMPVQVTAGDPDTTASGTITTTDLVVAAPAGDGALRTGTPTAGSYVAMLLPGGDSAWNAQVTGLTTGTLYFEESLDSTTGINGSWVAVNGRQTGVVNTVLSNAATTNGVWRGNTSGAAYVRVRSVGTLTGTPAIVIRASTGTGAIFLNASTPAGTNMIGSVRTAPSTTGTITSPALSASSFTVLALNTARLGAMVFNDSGNVLYLALASSASTTSYTVQIPPSGYFELSDGAVGYTGIITGISLAATGNARVTELT